MGWVVRGSNPDRSKTVFSETSIWLRGPPSLLFIRNWYSFQEVKQHGRDVNHSPPSKAEVKNEWSYTFTPPIAPWGKDRVSFNFTSLEERFFDVLPLAAGFANEWRKRDTNAAVKLLTFVYVFRSTVELHLSGRWLSGSA